MERPANADDWEGHLGSSRREGRGRRAVLAVSLLSLALAAPRVRSESLGVQLEQSWRWTQFTSWSGLPSDDVLALVEEEDGTPWVATHRGLAWFDGHAWNAVGEAEGLPEGSTAALAPLRGGGVATVLGRSAWAGGRGGFRRLPTPPGFLRGVVGLSDGRFLVHVGEDIYRLTRSGAAERIPLEQGAGVVLSTWPASRGRAFVAHSTGLLLVGAEDVREMLDVGSLPPSHCEVAQAIATQQEEVLFSIVQPIPLQGAWRSRRGVVERSGLAESEAVLHAAARADGAVVVAFESGALGLREDADSPWVIDVTPPAIGGVNALHFTASGDLWAATARGLWLCRLSSRRWTSHLVSADGDRNVVHAILRARDGRTWVGTRAGLEIHSPDGSVELLRSIAGRPIPTVTGLAQDREGAVWVGSGAGFEGAWRHLDGEWIHFGPEQGLDARRVHAVRVDRRGRPWLLGLSPHRERGGPGAFYVEGGRVRHQAMPGGDDSQRVYDFAQSEDGALWFATAGGLHRLKGSFWRTWGAAEGLAEDRVFTLELDASGRPWLSSGRLGVCHLPDDEAVICESTEDGLPHGRVWDLELDRRGTVWASTRAGLGARRDGAWSKVLPRHGLPLLRVWPLAADGERLWVGTMGRGLVELSLTEAAWAAPHVRFDPVEVESGGLRAGWRAHAYWGSQAEREVETRWRLDGGPWSAWDRRADLVRRELSPGEHLLEVESKGLLGQRLRRPAAVSFEVRGPFWARTEVVASVAALVLAALAWALFAFRRRRAHARELADREERFRGILDNAGDVIFTADLAGGLTLLNRAGRELLGAEAEASGWRSLLPLEFRERMERTGRAPFRSRPPGTYEVELPMPDGEPRTLEVHSRLVHAAGRPAEIQGVARDVTERRRIEAQLGQAQKRESLGLLAGGVAHDFNNLLHAILGNLELARSAWQRGDTPEAALDDLEDAADRATDLARVMLAYSGRARFEIRPLDLSELSEEMVRLLRASLPEQVRWELSFDPDLPAIEGDRAQVQQVVLNLVTNAADALGAAGGRLSVRTGSGPATEARRGEVVLDAELDDERVVWLEVGDEGPGIDAADRPRMFDPFFSTKGAGRGLGLSAVLGIVRAHRAALLVDSATGSGTRFRVVFPALLQPAPALDAYRAASAPGRRLTGALVLVVDDQERVRRVACRLLESLGCRTLEAADGLEAQEIVEGRAGDLDAVLLDLLMPRCSGSEALAAIHDIAPDLPVLLTSGYSEEEQSARAVGRGAAGFLKKPYRRYELEQALLAVMKPVPQPGPRLS